MKKIIFFFILITFSRINAQQINIIPKPNLVMLQMGNYKLDKNTNIIYDFRKANTLQKSTIEKLCNSLLKSSNFAKLGKIYIKYDNTFGDEAYQLYIGPDHIAINGKEKGIQYAFQSLKQLISSAQNNSLKNCLITDAPRFAYRGMHLDVGRHFQPVSFIKKYLDYMAMYKYNTFHWHLTEDQGWRIEIKKYPKLTSVGAWRNGTIVGRYPGTDNDNKKYGGFYTQEQIKEIVQYAADRSITVIPEIELPGHSSAAIAAYPELSCFPKEPTKIPNQFIADASKNNSGKLVQETWGVFEDVFCPSEYTFKFLEDVFDEVLQLFPGKLIHIGGDECPKEAWKKSAFCQQMIKEKGLKDEHGLQSYFIQRIEKYLNSKGRNIIGWDEILEGGLAPNAAVMSWRGEEGGIEAAKQHHTVVMTPGSHCYLDHSQSKNEDSVTIGSFLPVEKVYEYEPIPNSLTEEEAKYILGAQGNVWTEYMKYPSKIEYMIFPRMLALSEVLWSPKEGRSWAEFEPRLLEHMKQLKQKGINLSDAMFDIQFALTPSEKKGELLVKLSSKTKNKPLSLSWEPSEIIGEKQVYKTITYEKPFPVSKSIDLIAGYFANPLKGKSYSIRFNKATGQELKLLLPPSKSYPGNGGAFGLVNGMQSEKGIQSSEWLGFAEGKDAEIVLDLGSVQEISKVKVHTLNQQGSWIYLPEYIEVFASNDGINFGFGAKSAGLDADKMGMQYMYLNLTPVKTRYLKIVVKNFGVIPSGKPGASHGAWLFLDELIVE